MNIGLFYGSSTCYTEMAAEKIRDIIGPELVTLHNLKDDSPALMSQYDVLILGIPTWDFGEIQEDWEAVWDQLDTLNLEGKIVALYGMGDQLGYGEWFLDALGMLHDKLATKGVKFVGYWPTEGYEFTSPKPVIADGQLFVGLALDETNQYDLSDERIQSWCEQILGEMAEHFFLTRLTPAPVFAAPAGADRATLRRPCCPPPAKDAVRAGYRHGANAAAYRY